MTRTRILTAQALVVCALAVAHADFESDADKLIAAPELEYALVGVHIIDAASGKVLYSRNPDTRMLPASNQKILTGAAAHQILGGDFIYRTRVLVGGKPDENGVVAGAIALKGSGDPSLSHEQVEKLAERVHAAGAVEIKGPVLADASAFSDSRLGTGWSWGYLDTYYAAEISALTVDRGCVEAIVRGASKPGGPPILRLEPFSEYLTLSPAAITAASVSHKPGIYRHLGKNVLALSGPIGVDQRVQRRVTVRDPAIYCATLFKQALVKAGVRVAGGVEAGKAREDAHQLCCVDSQPLAHLLRRVNKNSDNNYAELILRTLSLAKEGTGSRSASVRIIDAWVEGLGADSKAFLMYDGSGLSRMNCMTPRFLVQVLRHMQDKTEWTQTLPVMGRDGTLGGRLKGTVAEGRVRAKTGSVAGVRALSGYAQTKSGRSLIFAIFVNNALGSGPALNMQNALCLLMADQ